MRSSTQQLLRQLEDTIQGLTADSGGGFGSEGSEPVQTLIREADKLGRFNLIRYLKHIGYLRAIETEDFLSDCQHNWQGYKARGFFYQWHDPSGAAEVIRQRWANLIDLMQASCTNVHLYEFNDNFNKFQIIVGCTSDRDWIGIAPQLEVPHTVHFGERVRIKRSARPPGKETLELMARIEPLNKDLKGYINEKHQEQFCWEIAESEEIMIEKLLVSSNFLIIWEFTGFASKETIAYWKAHNVTYEFGSLEARL